jgi:hypothetical protein
MGDGVLVVVATIGAIGAIGAVVTGGLVRLVRAGGAVPVNNAVVPCRQP